jgi:hypothetical protein
LDVVVLVTHASLARVWRAIAAAIVLAASLGQALVPSMTVSAGTVLPPAVVRGFPFDEADCGPASENIPGPPPRLIVVGQPMSDSWLMCYLKRDFEGQTFFFDRWGDARKTSFRGYPVECWNAEADPGAGGRRTDGIVAEVYGWNLDHTQYVRFTYRIQMDGDYINNCHQEILPAPGA